MIDKIKQFTSNHALAILMALAIVASITSFFIAYFGGYILAYGDAASHLDISRRVSDNLTPGIAQLGGYWLPLFHILMLMFVWNDFLWHSGIAGSLVSMFSFIGAAYYCFKLIKVMTRNSLAALAGSLVFILNPNLLYLQAVPMGESLFLFTTITSIYYLVVWNEEDNISYLIFSAFFVFMSALNRYEGWAVVLIEVLIVAIWSFAKNGRKKSEGMVVIFSSVALLAPLIWFIWNAAIFGDPLVFIHGEFSSRGQQEVFEERGLLPTVGNLWFSIKYYLLAIAENNGYIFSILAIIALPFIAMERKFRIAILPLFSIVIFEITCLYKGITILYLPYLEPFGRLFNVRYGIFAIFIFAIMVGYLMDGKRFGKIRPLTITLVIFLFIFQEVLFFQSMPISLKEPIMISENRGNVESLGANFIGNEYNGGHILILAAVNEPLILLSGLNIKEFISEGNSDLWKKALNKPDQYAEWIIADEDKEDNNLLKRINPNFSIYDSYKPVFTKNGLSIFKKI